MMTITITIIIIIIIIIIIVIIIVMMMMMMMMMMTVITYGCHMNPYSANLGHQRDPGGLKANNCITSVMYNE